MTYLDGDGNPAGSDITTAAELATAAAGKDLVVLTSSMVPASIKGDIFAGLAIPVITSEGTTWDDDKFVTAGKAAETSSTHTQITIVAPSHPCAGGLTGDITLLGNPKKLNYAIAASLPAGVTPIATVKGDSTRVVLWAVEAGGVLDDATTASERRGGFPTIYDAAAHLTGDGWTLFDAMVDWVGNPTAAITPSATHSGTDVHTAAGQAVDSAATKPEVMLEVAWGVNWDTEPADAQWSDESPKVRHPQMIRFAGGGRSADLGRTEPGSMSFAFDNRTRSFEPGYAPNVRPRTHVRLKVKWHGVEHHMWRGYITSWQPLYPDKGHDSIVMVQAVDLHAVAANTELDGGHINNYIKDSPGGLHIPLDEQSGDYAREIITPLTNGLWIANVNLNDDTFAADGVSKSQYPRKDNAAQAYEPLFNMANTGPMTIMFWFRNNGTTVDPWYLAEVRDTSFAAYFYSWRMQLDGGIDVTWNNDGGSAYTTVVATSDGMDGNWHFISLVRSGSGTSWTVQAFLDGQPLADAVTGPVETPGGVDPAQVIAYGWNFLGWTGQISVFSEALSDVAITEIYDSYLDIFPQQATSDRIETILSSYLSLDPALINLDTGLSVMPTRNLHRKSVAEALDKAAEAELGLFFIDGKGRATLHNRTRRNLSVPILEVGQGTAVPISDVGYRSAEDMIVNTVVVDRAEGTDSASAVDRTCVAQDGEKRLDVALDVTQQDLSQSYADHLLATRKTAALRIDRVTYKPDPSTYGTLLAAKLSDRLRVKHDPIDDNSVETHFKFPGAGASGDFLESPASPALNVGDLQVICKLSNPGATGVSNPVGGQWGSSDAWLLGFASGGLPYLAWSADGFSTVSGAYWASSMLSAAVGEDVYLKGTVDVDNGASASELKFYESATGEEGDWAQLGVTRTLTGSLSIFNSTEPLNVGAYLSGYASFRGDRIYWLEVYDGIDGTLVASCDAADAIDDDTSFVSSATSEPWTPNGNVTLEGKDIDYHGFIEHLGWEIDAEDWATTHRISPQALSITNF